MDYEKNFDILDLINLIKNNIFKIFLFTLIYFTLVFFIDNQLKNLSKKSQYLSIEISNLKLDQLPNHYLNLDNILGLDENFYLIKKNIISNYIGERRHLTNFMKHHRFIDNDHNQFNQFLREIRVSQISKANISIEIHNEKYYRNIDKKKIVSFLDKINHDIYEEILELSNNFNQSLMQLENILNKLDTKLDNNYSSIKQPIYSLNKEILNNFENNKFAKIFKVFNIKEIEIIDNPYNIFNKFKLYIFYGITYVVLLLIIIILFYSYKLNKTKFIN